MAELETWVTWGLTALGVALGFAGLWLWWRQRKPAEPAPEPTPKPDSRLVQLARDVLEQRKKEHQWGQFRDFVGWALPFSFREDDDEEYEEGW